MTKLNMKMNVKPFFLAPVGKDYLWGGNRLNYDFSKNIDLNPLAETWECSTHIDGPSKIKTGVFKNRTLKDVLKDHPEFLGNHFLSNFELPILVKFIDAKQDLSVQVHPSDEYALKNENGQIGKTEMWYVIDAKPNSSLIYGLSHTISKERLKKSIGNGTLEKYLQKVPVKSNDVFFIEAGTIHAIGKGCLIAEIQENSNLTYRLYDYNRIDKNGEKRELHIDKALEVAKLTKEEEPKQPMRVLNYRPGCATELLARCKYFEVYRMIVNTERCSKLVGYKAHKDSFRVLLCYKGCGSIYMEDGEILPFFKGDCIFFPANSMKIRIHGNAQFLDIKG